MTCPPVGSTILAVFLDNCLSDESRGVCERNLPRGMEKQKRTPEKESAHFLILFKLRLYAGLLCNNGRRFSKCRRESLQY